MYTPPGIGEPTGQEAGSPTSPPYSECSPYPMTGSPYETMGYVELTGLACPYTAAAGSSTRKPCGPPLRVTHIGPNMLRGGAEMWLRSLIRHLDPRRVRVVECLVSQPALIDPTVCAEMGVPVNVGNCESIRRAAAESDILLCWGPAELAHWLRDHRPKLCVFIAHGEGPWTLHMLDQAAPVIDHVIAVSRWVEQSIPSGFPVTRISNGVDEHRLGQSRSRRAMRQALGFRPEDFVLGYVGRFSGEKQAHLVLEAVALLPPHFKALLVGWGRERIPLLELANDLLPGRFAFATAGNDVGDYYAALDAMCMPSLEEGFGLVVLEAMLCRRPVIATSVGCVPEIIQHRINGVVVEGTPESIADAARSLADHPHWAAGLAAEGRAYAEEHGHARTMARRYEEVLHQLWAERGHAVQAR